LKKQKPFGINAKKIRETCERNPAKNKTYRRDTEEGSKKRSTDWVTSAILSLAGEYNRRRDRRRYRFFMKFPGRNAHPNRVEKRGPGVRGRGCAAARFARRTGGETAGATNRRFFHPVLRGGPP